MNALAPFTNLYVAGDSMAAYSGLGHADGLAYPNLFAALNGMPVFNAASGGWMMKDAALTAFGNGINKWNKSGIVILNAGANDMGQNQDARAIDAYRQGLRHFMFTVNAASRINENTGAWTSSGTWNGVASDLYGTGTRYWTAQNGAWRKVQFTGTECVLTVWGFDDSKFTGSYTGGAAFKVYDENNVLVYDGTVTGQGSSNRCWNSRYFSATAGHLVPLPIHIVFGTGGSHTLKIVHCGTSTQQLWVDDAMIPGTIRPLVIKPRHRYFHPNWQATHPQHTDALVTSYIDVDEEEAANFPNLLVRDIYRDTTDAMYHTDWAHLIEEGHANALANLIADTSALALSITL